MNKGLNLKSVKNENRSLILYLLNSNGAMSRKEIAKSLGLTPAAVTKICAELISIGFVEELKSENTGRSGRKEIPLSLNLKNKAAFCINAENDAITFSIALLDGKLLKKEQIPFSQDVDYVAEKAKRFLRENNDYFSSVIGAGICVIGSTEEDDFGMWKDKRLLQKFENALEIPVVIENNVKAFAEGELIYGSLKNNNSVLFLKWGSGIGSAIVANGKVFSGNDSSVAEIGHYIVNPGGVKCRCGRYGCLETEAGEAAIINEINTKQTLDEALENCNNNIVNIIEHKIDLVALALTNTATILNAENIVLFGKMFTNKMIAEKLKKQCLRYNENFDDSMINLSSLNSKSCYIGAAALCAKHFFFEKAN